MNSDQVPFVAEPSFGVLHPYEHPVHDWFDTKTSGWVANSFSGGMQLDFSSLKREGMRAVVVYILKAVGAGVVWAMIDDEKHVDDNPSSGSEHAHRIMEGPQTLGLQTTLLLSKDYKCKIAVSSVSIDIHVAYPKGYYL